MAMISPLNWLKAYLFLFSCFMVILVLKWWKLS